MITTLGDLFTPEELAKAEMLYDAAHDGEKYNGMEFHAAVKEYVVRPALARINNETLKQQNDESYLSFVLEMAIAKRKQRRK